MKSWRRWSSRGAASLLDQGLFSGSQFALNIVLARWLSVSDYARFAIIYAVIVFVNGVYLAFVAEPALVFWSKHRARRADFINDIFLINSLFLCVAFLLACGGAGLLFWHGDLAAAQIPLLLALGLVLPFFWLFRQLAYADGRPWLATAQSGLYGLVLIGGTMLTGDLRMLSLKSALLVMLLASAIVGLWGFRLFRPRLETRISGPSAAALQECLVYGNWSAPSAITTWVINNVFIVLLPAVASLADVAQLKSLLNLFLPFQQVLLAVNLVILPTLARAVIEQKLEKAWRLFWLFTGAALAGGAIMCAILCLWGDGIYALVYGARYQADYTLIWCGIGLPLLWPLITTMRTMLRALQMPKAAFAVNVTVLLIAGAVAIPAGAAFGARGALLAMTGIHAALAAALLWTVMAARREGAGRAPVSAATPAVASAASVRPPVPTLLLCGVPYSANLGDGVIADCTAMLLRRHAPGYQVAHLDIAGRTGFEARALRGRRHALFRLLHLVPPRLRFLIVLLGLEGWIGPKLSRAWWPRIADCEAVVIGGGQLLMDSDLNFPLKIRRLAALVRAADRPLAFYACGVGRRWSRLARHFFRQALTARNVVEISVRDRESADSLRQHLAGHAIVPEVTVDPAVWAAAVYGPPEDDGRGTDAKPRLAFGISAPAILNAFLPPPQHRSEAQMIRLLAEALADLAASFDILLFTNGASEDEAFLDWLWADIEASLVPGVIRSPVPRCPAELANIVRGSAVLVSHRLHANILAYAYKIPSVGLGWDSKLESFFRLSGRDDFFLKAGDMSCPAIVQAVRRASMSPIDEGVHEALLTMASEGVAVLAASLSRGARQ